MLMLQKELLERCSSAENMKQPLLIISHQRIDFHLLELSGSSEPSINCCVPALQRNKRQTSGISHGFHEAHHEIPASAGLGHEPMPRSS